MNKKKLPQIHLSYTRMVFPNDDGRMAYSSPLIAIAKYQFLAHMPTLWHTNELQLKPQRVNFIFKLAE